MPKQTSLDGKKTNVRTSVTLSADDYSELERIAEKKKVSVAWVVREAVDSYLNQEAPLLRNERNRT